MHSQANARRLEVDSTGNDHDASASSQYLTFFMSGEEYGVDILCVQEIRGWENATPLPNSPPHIKGVINLRGTIVPIVDLRRCFNLAAIEYSSVTVVIVLKIKTDNGNRVVGIVVDAVSDVYSVAESDMRRVPDLGGMDTQFVRALVTVNERMVILLNIDQLMAMDGMPNVSDLRVQIDNFKQR